MAKNGALVVVGCPTVSLFSVLLGAVMRAKVCVLYFLAFGFRRCFLLICAFSSFKSTSGECSRTGNDHGELPRRSSFSTVLCHRIRNRRWCPAVRDPLRARDGAGMGVGAVALLLCLPQSNPFWRRILNLITFLFIHLLISI